MSGHAVAIPLGLPLLEASCSQPGDESSTHSPPIWPCSGWGLPAAASLQTAGSSYLPISPLLRQAEAVCFCGAFRRVTPPGRYPAPCPVGARTFLSLPTNRERAATRPTGPAHIVAARVEPWLPMPDGYQRRVIRKPRGNSLWQRVRVATRSNAIEAKKRILNVGHGKLFQLSALVR